MVDTWDGESLLRARLREGLDREVVAGAIGVRVDRWLSWERGATPPDDVRERLERWIRESMT